MIHASKAPVQSAQAFQTAQGSSTRIPAPVSQSVVAPSSTRPAHPQKRLAQGGRTSMSKSLSIFTASPNIAMYCARLANCHMLRSLCNVLGASTCSSMSISLAARLRAGIVEERAAPATRSEGVVWSQRWSWQRERSRGRRREYAGPKRGTWTAVEAVWGAWKA